MKAWMKAAICISLSLMCLFACFGYAAISDNLKISGDIQSEASVPDIYITNVTPSTSAGVSVVGYSGTVLTVNIVAEAQQRLP